MIDKNFNELERAVFAWYMERYAGTSVARQISTARFLNRKWTRVGFYVDFEVPEVSETSLGRTENPIGGPYLESKEIENGGGSLLWQKNGFLVCLELYANGFFFEEIITEFKLIDPAEIG